MTIDDVNKLATLARIKMSEDEKNEFLENMESILGYVDIIKKADVSGIEKDAGKIRNVMREDADAYDSGTFTDKILASVPATQDGFVKVKKIL